MARGKTLFDAVCGQRDQIPLVLAVCIVMGLLLIFPLAFLDRGTVGYTIAVLDGIIVLVCLTLLGPVYWYCTKLRIK